MAEWMILTNNPLVKSKEPFRPRPDEPLESRCGDRLFQGLENYGDIDIMAVGETGLAAVLEKALELAQSGWRLISAPLPPNLPLIRSPYRSLLWRRQDRQYDPPGLAALAKAEAVALKLGTSACEGQAARDAALIDREILLRTFRECGLEVP